MRKGIVALAALLVLALLATAALPWLASTQIVRDRIAYELSLWSGYRVSLGETPILDVWPGFKATLHHVAFHEWANAGAPPVLEADRLEVSLSALAALSGNVVMSAVSMHRPLLRLTVEGSVLDLPASPGGGRMTRAVDMAKAVVANNPTAPDTAALPSDAFGTVEFTEGRVALINGNADDGLSSLNGRIVWPAFNRSGRISATGIWRGENIAIEANAAQPLLLLAGGSTQVGANLKSTLLEASFEGTTNLAGEAYFDGQASLSSSSLRRMLEWSRTDIAPGAAIGAVSIAGGVQGSAQRLQLDSVDLNLDGNAAHGVLEISFAEAVPAISGTLAFESLALRSFLSAFTPAAAGNGNIYDEIDTGFSKQLSLDLRLSAPTATLGSMALTNLAAAARVKGDLAVFDISDASVFGGTLQAGVRVDAADDNRSVEMRAMASNIDTFALAKGFGMERLVPQGRGAFSLMLKGTGRDWNTVMGNAEGTVSASLGEGALAGLDLNRFRERLSAGGFFALSEVQGGPLPLRGFDFKARVIGGVAHIEKAELRLDQQQVISITGLSPYFSRALALSGHFATVGEDGQQTDLTMPFFIGGAWDAPFISPAWFADDYQ
ncbi:AsmA-like C-terminal region-containing protein [Mesorhizobium sp. CAU 1741]|uniref:AsmA family protein n=1 Tax=Mesorhizobium sp. CAU 1741 TaxID=3140366 RepID=UPI00325BB201